MKKIADIYQKTGSVYRKEEPRIWPWLVLGSIFGLWYFW